jgi:hypothetical protein
MQKIQRTGGDGKQVNAAPGLADGARRATAAAAAALAGRKAHNNRAPALLRQREAPFIQNGDQHGYHHQRANIAWGPNMALRLALKASIRSSLSTNPKCRASIIRSRSVR